MNSAEKIKANVVEARKLAAEIYGENPPPEIVAAILNSMTAQNLADQISDAASQVSNALFQTS